MMGFSWEGTGALVDAKTGWWWCLWQGSSGGSPPSLFLLLRSPSSTPLSPSPLQLLGLSFSSSTPPCPSLPFLHPFSSSARKAPVRARLQRDEDLATVVPAARELGIMPMDGDNAPFGSSPKLIHIVERVAIYRVWEEIEIRMGSKKMTMDSNQISTTIVKHFI